MIRATYARRKCVSGDGLAAVNVTTSSISDACREAGKVLVSATRCGAARGGAARNVKVGRARHSDLAAGGASDVCGVRVGHLRRGAIPGIATVGGVAAEGGALVSGRLVAVTSRAQ